MLNYQDWIINYCHVCISPLLLRPLHDHEPHGSRGEDDDPAPDAGPDEDAPEVVGLPVDDDQTDLEL